MKVAARPTGTRRKSSSWLRIGLAGFTMRFHQFQNT